MSAAPRFDDLSIETPMASSASIFAVATEETARAEAAAWTRFSAARDQPEFCVAWLSILCLQIERVTGGLLLGPDQDGAYTPAATCAS
jgi:hypothetical protein